LLAIFYNSAQRFQVWAAYQKWWWSSRIYRYFDAPKKIFSKSLGNFLDLFDYIELFIVFGGDAEIRTLAGFNTSISFRN